MYHYFSLKQQEDILSVKNNYNFTDVNQFFLSESAPEIKYMIRYMSHVLDTGEKYVNQESHVLKISWF